MLPADIESYCDFLAPIDDLYMGLPIFHFKQFSVLQHHAAMKVNTDSVLLGAWLNATNPHSILDIGTGTGIIALMMAQRFPDAQIVAVEIDHGACLDAEINFKSSVWKKQIHLYHADFKEWALLHQKTDQYDLIVTNPPFFKNSLLAEDASRQTARHQTSLDIRDLFMMATTLLSDVGKIAMVFPFEGLQEILSIARECSLHQARTCYVRSRPTSAPHRVLFEFSKRSEKHVEAWHTLKTAQGHGYSQEHLEMAEAFYLEK